MGAWGLESCSNDSCWDWLYADNIHEITSEEIDQSCAKYLGYHVDEHGDKYKLNPDLSHNWEYHGKQLISRENQQDFAGIVIWGLRHGCSVKPEYLELAKTCIIAMRDDDEYLSDWSTAEERKACLIEELADVEAAMANPEHTIPPKHIRGLFERIFDMGQENAKVS